MAIPKESTKKQDKKLKDESKIDEASKVETAIEKVEENKVEDVKEKKIVKQKEIPKKDVAIANGFSLKISPKQSKYVMRIIRGKSPEAAVVRLEDVISEKRPVPMAGLEVGHKKGKGLAGGKFPKNACKAIIEIVKQAKANSVVAGIENPVITIASSDRASAPYRKAGRKAKRAHIHIEIRDKTKLIGKTK
ncbi:MAG: uL22 family ribosomal protein [archaeon]